MAKNRRPSVYLQERCEDLSQVLEFFLARHHGQSPSVKEMLVVFLSQLAFWEWELDNLIYAFANFKDRSTAWVHENGYGFANALRTHGILVRTQAVKDMKVKRLARAERKREVFAPVDSLNEVIRLWNQILDLCEERVLLPLEDREEAVKLGAQVLPDLAKFRKAPIAQSPDGETGAT